jgi:hypothetical protein
MRDAAIVEIPEAALAAADHDGLRATPRILSERQGRGPLLRLRETGSRGAGRDEGGLMPEPGALASPLTPQGSVMPQKAWSAKRERQYVHIRESLLDRGKPRPLAEEIAARVVNKERAQHGESVEASASSINDMSSGRRGGLRSHKGPGGRTLLQLRNEARQRGLKGRSTMNKAQLEAALTP